MMAHAQWLVLNLLFLLHQDYHCAVVVDATCSLKAFLNPKQDLQVDENSMDQISKALSMLMEREMVTEGEFKLIVLVMEKLLDKRLLFLRGDLLQSLQLLLSYYPVSNMERTKLKNLEMNIWNVTSNYDFIGICGTSDFQKPNQIIPRHKHCTLPDPEYIVTFPKPSIRSLLERQPTVVRISIFQGAHVPHSRETGSDYAIEVYSDVPPPSVELTFRSGYGQNYTGSCLSWHSGTGSNISYWTPNSCKVTMLTDTHVTCSCTHMSYFTAIFWQEPHSLGILPSTAVIKTGFIFSIVPQLASLFVFCTFAKFRNKFSLAIVEMALCLLLIDLVFLFQFDKSSSHLICGMVAFALHNLMLCLFMLLLVINGLLLYALLHNIPLEFVPGRYLNFFTISCWFCPMIVTLNFYSYDKTIYSVYRQKCWLTKDGFWRTFMIPFDVIMASSLLVLLVASLKMYKYLKDSALDQDFVENIKYHWIMITISFFVTYFCWLMGSLANDSTAASYLFCISALLQGIVLFLMIITSYSRGRYLWKRFYRFVLEKYEPSSEEEFSSYTKFNVKLNKLDSNALATRRSSQDMGNQNELMESAKLTDSDREPITL